MKKLISLIVLIIVSLNLFSQEIQPVEYRPVKIDYLAKSKKQQNVGWILTGTGIAVTYIATAVMAAHLETLTGSEVEPESRAKVRGVLFLTGAATLATGITFLSIAKKNKRKALSISLINDSFRYNKGVNTSVPSVRLQLQF